MSVTLCVTCAVETATTPDVCPICADERQWVPEEGQLWTTLDELRQNGTRAFLQELEPGLVALRTEPGVGIGQWSKLVVRPEGNVLWDPLGYLDDEIVAQVRELGPVVAIASSHPHMFGVQVEWSRALGGVPVLVADADREWVQRPDDSLEYWSGSRELVPGVTLLQVGGHFPGSAVITATGMDGASILLAGDTIFPNADRKSVSFMRSYPNNLPLSAAVVRRIADQLAELKFERVYGNFENHVPRGAARVIEDSAQRHIDWVSGKYDHLT
ncbi:MBL fold metallo-hydrolase [Herbiconiux sp. SYSU D00978]|uniref:MBL fold metallo-hydrolase n=1 Tax=Herbiconiux sp. SYSU D00978 TaxID=2812562 RepID=UPI001A97002B|nr:MBL fold metallo-hydrolase [Herbiconiux sp. SYSU D00978]